MARECNSMAVSGLSCKRPWLALGGPFLLFLALKDLETSHLTL